MAIAARLEQSSETQGTQREPRRTLRLEAKGTLPSGGAAEVMVHNISATGLLLESRVALAEGERIEIDLPHAGATWAEVVWTSGTYFGCRFDMPISGATLNAAQLRSAVDSMEQAPPLRQISADESLGRRISRLRKERRITLSRIADELGVSKPTVWAWEHGRARPVEGRIEALARVLGVTAGELVAGGERGELGDLLERSREEIARAFGTKTESVRIMIEL